MIEQGLHESQINILTDYRMNKAPLFSFIAENSNDAGAVNSEDENSFLYLLMKMPVTKLSIFTDNQWDYNDDVLNPVTNVKGAKLKINFDKYPDIPDFILIEFKCLLHYLILNAKVFAAGGRNKKQKGKIKPNTAIAQFESGLRYINHVFCQLNDEYGSAYVKNKFRTFSDIQFSDFQVAANKFTYCVNSAMMKFFYYLKHPFSQKILDHEVQVDFDALEWPEFLTKKRDKRLVFENKIFEKTISNSSFRIVEFLTAMGEKIEDATAAKHFERQKEVYKPSGLTAGLVNDYTISRLLAKGYSQVFIGEKCNIPKEYCSEDGSLLVSRKVRVIIKKKYSIRHLDEVRLAVNEAYYAACYLVGQYTGMRPNALSEIVLSSCLINEDRYDLVVSEEKKGKDESYNLFDDKWIAIPIVRDAIKVARILSVCKNNEYLFSNADTVSPNSKATNMTSVGMTCMMNNYLSMIFDKKIVRGIVYSPYMMRHTLTYQLYRAELGLPFISFQLKHLVDSVGKYSSSGATCKTTLGYGEIADMLGSDATKGKNKSIRRLAEIERVKSVMDPNATYLGEKGKEHKDRLQKAFQGYMASGYTEDEVYEKMAEQGMALINVGTGFCFGGVENFDESLPCIGTLRCNPNRCPNAVVTKANAPKWREVYITNTALLGKKGYEKHELQLKEAIKEAEGVLIYLEEEVIL